MRASLHLPKDASVPISLLELLEDKSLRESARPVRDMSTDQTPLASRKLHIGKHPKFCHVQGEFVTFIPTEKQIIKSK